MTAEAVVVGIALLSERGCASVRDILVPEDFYDVQLRRLYQAACELADLDGWRVTAEQVRELQACDPQGWRRPISGEHFRVAAAATMADVGFMEAQSLVSGAPSFVGTRWAHKVKDDAERRRAMAWLADAYVRLDEGEELGAVLG